MDSCVQHVLVTRRSQSLLANAAGGTNADVGHGGVVEQAPGEKQHQVEHEPKQACEERTSAQQTTDSR